MEMMRVLIADDHLAIRSGIKSLLSSAFPGVEIEETGHGTEVIGRLRGAEWAILLLDVDMPDISGFDVLAQMQQAHIRIPVLVFSFHKEEQIISRAFELGAAGYLTKDAGGQLLPVIRRILAGERNVTL